MHIFHKAFLNPQLMFTQKVNIQFFKHLLKYVYLQPFIHLTNKLVLTPKNVFIFTIPW